ncbi:MAG: hypothetical protein M1819_003596 [Sarea resinae]|nr:MAG: hypothetical protein M1819_003596 [Sarea resinae]
MAAVDDGAAFEDFDLFTSMRYDPMLLDCKENSELYGEPNPYYMLSYHRDRMLAAAQHFGWEEAIATLNGQGSLASLATALSSKIDQHCGVERTKTVLKLRILLSREGHLTIEPTATSAVPLDALYPTELKLHDSFVPSSRTGGALQLGADDKLLKSPNGDESIKKPNSGTIPGPWHIFIDSKPTSVSPLTKFKTTSRDMYDAARKRVGIQSYQDPSEVILVNPEGEVMEGSLTSVYFLRGGRWVTPPTGSGGQAGTTRRWLLRRNLCVEETVNTDSIRDKEECYISNGVRGLVWGRVHLSEV